MAETTQRLDEQRHAQPETRPHRRRTNRRRWCRGKPGVEHQLGEAAIKVWPYRHARSRPPCEWWATGSWGLNAAGVKVWTPRKWHWSCSHQRRCTTCGKIVVLTLGVGCPDYTPRETP